ncbi:TetR/AcrR family transcriptional regulator C-terminal domain-containing protein [Kribbella sp. NPDC050820]|uniref:TetR/AcrR family transcriptional regulator C-terminal domain-containing protein n=1 Tax=Kribbella sp. NPDC050820 TaxID=3155408 RepID=UPI0033EEAA97
MSEAPYQVIAAEIRRRIEAGELAAGDRVPSTRGLVREFGVAMATATKALQVLQQQDLVHAQPGVGTVVGSPPAAVRPTREQPLELNREQVVRRAIAIADAEGLAGVSMRRIAAELGVSTMALYRYVGGKEALVLRMVDTAIGEFPFPAEPATTWRAGIETAAHLQWAAYRRHLWLASAISLSRPQALPNLLPHTDAVLRALGPFGLDGSTALYTAITVFAYVRGVALAMEAEVQAEQDTGMTADEWADEHLDPLSTMISLEGLAGFRAVFQPGFDFDYDLDRLFEFGLELVLDGLEVKLSRLR